MLQCAAGASAVLLGTRGRNGVHRALGLVDGSLAPGPMRARGDRGLAVGLGRGPTPAFAAAIALAQGWQLGRGVRIIGLDSVECLAAGAERERIFGHVNIIIDAKRNEFYLAGRDVAPDSWRVTEPLRLAPRADIEALARRGGRLLGPDAAEWFPSARNLYPDAAILGRLAAVRRDFTPGEKLEPVYLREPAFKKAPPPRLV